MAKGVGLTCGIATQLLLDGNPAFNTPGVLAPYSRELCDPIRARVEDEGIKLVERVLWGAHLRADCPRHVVGPEVTSIDSRIVLRSTSCIRYRH